MASEIAWQSHNSSDETQTKSSKKRKLPSWMVKTQNSCESSRQQRGKGPDLEQVVVREPEEQKKVGTSSKVKTRCLPASITECLSDSQLPQLHFPGRIYYCFNKDDCNFICEDLSNKGCVSCGFDIEWRVVFGQGGIGRKTSLLQLCPSSEICYLFHLSCMNGFPSALKSLLENEGILKAGVGINGDTDKLAREFDVLSKGVIDLSVLANEKTNSKENWSLTGLVMHLFKRQLNKDPRIRCSNWENTPLSEEQTRYAAIDAYAGYIIYNKLESMASKTRPLNNDTDDTATEKPEVFETM